MLRLIEKTEIKKAGYDHGWENEEDGALSEVVLGSALHDGSAIVREGDLENSFSVLLLPALLAREVAAAGFPRHIIHGDFTVNGTPELALLLRAGSRLAKNLPNRPENRYKQQVAHELKAQPILTTEIERIIKQRVGQSIYRESLMEYWDGRCAVTGIAVPALLRASHAKAWAECESDSERLSVFNGFLLCAHLDALFDRYLMTFDELGIAHFAPSIDSTLLEALGLKGPIKLTRISKEHLLYLAWHRNAFIEQCKKTEYTALEKDHSKALTLRPLSPTPL